MRIYLSSIAPQVITDLNFGLDWMELVIFGQSQGLEKK